jgi:hypothetical protein
LCKHNARPPGSGQSAVGGTGAGLSDHRATCVTARSYACIDVCRSGLFCREELGTLNNVLVVMLVIEVRDSLGFLPAQLPLAS